MSAESKWTEFSPELKEEVRTAVHSGQQSFVPSVFVRAEAEEHTHDGGLFSSSTLKNPDEDAVNDPEVNPRTLLISDKLAEHIRTEPQDNSPYDDGAILQGEHRTPTSPASFDHDPGTFSG